MIPFSSPLPRPDRPNENYFKLPYFYWPNACDHDMVDRITAVGESLDVVDAAVGETVENSGAFEELRVSRVSWIRPQPQHQFIFEKLVELVDRVNYYHYGLDLHGIDDFQYTRYGVGGHYTYHNDLFFDSGMLRKLSMVLSLTDQSEYQGGDFCFSPHGTNPEKFRFNKGDLIVFPSYIPHKVEPVTSGHRITLVNWFYGPTFV